MTPWALRILNHFGEGRPQIWNSRQWRNLVFKNPLGVAGGLDKNAEYLKAWWNLGAGFVEIGTVTPEPQGPNEGQILSRDSKARALWNRMGFPSHGVEDVFFNLTAFQPFVTPIFVNVGKNRTTSLENAHQDYLAVMTRLHSLADVFVINISSPNTPGLRDLQKKDNLLKLLVPLVEFCRQNNNKPLLVKLSPDLTREELSEVVLTAESIGVDGFVLVNTTLSREAHVNFPKEGGLSGLPLKNRAEEALLETIKILGPKREGKLIVSVGGIFSSNDILRRLELGADLVQAYSALVFEGPGFFKQIAEDFRKKAGAWTNK